MSTILEELTKYRSVLCEMDHPRRMNCTGCGRDKQKKFLAPIKGKDGLFCEICRIPYGRKKEVKESKCKFCHKPVELVPSAAERARKHGGSPSDYIALFPNHASCELANRKKGDLEATAKRRERDEANGPVILKRTMKEAALLKWRVSPVATGRYRSFERRMWPSAEYQDGSPAVQLICKEHYSSRTAVADNLEIRVGLANHSNPSNKETGAGFTWVYLAQPAASLQEAKSRATRFLEAHPEFAPKPEEPEAAPETVVTEYQNPAELPAIRTNSAIVDLGKQNAMEELGDIIAKIPPHQVVPYAEFGKTLVSLHRKFKPGSDEKVVDFARGWNSILQKVNELVPKSREKHMTKDELETVLSLVGQKELNWN